MDSEVAKAITKKTFYDYEAQTTTNNEDIWLKSLDPLDLLKHGWLLQKYEKPPMMMLIQQYGQDMGTEVGFRLQGILVDMNLPPVHVPSYNLQQFEKNIPGMCQYVTITSLDQVVFNNSLKAIYALHDSYGKCLKEGVVDKWVASSYRNYPTASFSFQYLSPKSHGDAVAISSLVDPLGLIQKCDDQFVNNVVHYYCHSGPNTEMNAPVYAYEPADPAIFHLGHIVKFKVVFYPQPSRTKGHWFFDTTLCSISLIDSSIDQALLKIKMDKGDYHKPKFTPPHGLKRVSGIWTLEDQHVENTRKEMHRLKIVEIATYSTEDVRENSMEVERYSKTGRSE
ncbi:hypothetical protein K439DRAFT_1620607 [Ramaria rubella]|nr:hypothetical protein K439DRAFT_1620607 [Ramaria rubella]